jgi:hypothetical protein
MFCVLGVTSLGWVMSCGSDDGKKRVRGDSEGGAAGAAVDAGGSAGVESAAGGEAGRSIVTSTGGANAGNDAGGNSAGGVAEPSGGVSSASGAGGESDVGVSCELAPTCSNDLSGIGTGDFSIAFTLATTANAGSGIVSQRAICMRSKFWDVRLRGNGNLSVELDDETSYLNMVVPSIVNDGSPHEVRVCRKNGHVYAFADGQLLQDAPNATAFDTLPTLATGTTTCTARDGTVTLVGSVSDVCVGAL